MDKPYIYTDEIKAIVINLDGHDLDILIIQHYGQFFYFADHVEMTKNMKIPIATRNHYNIYIELDSSFDAISRYDEYIDSKRIRDYQKNGDYNVKDLDVSILRDLARNGLIKEGLFLIKL